MNRGKKIIFISHCILNANAKVGGLATYPGAQKGLVSFLADRGVGMVQLPCPEMELLGLRRWGHVKDQFLYPHFTRSCHKMLAPFVRQAQMYTDQGYALTGVVGIDGSPCCGVNKTCRSGQWAGDFLDPGITWDKVQDLTWAKEPGIFMEIFQSMLTENRIQIDFFGLEESAPELTQDLSRALSASIDTP